MARSQLPGRFIPRNYTRLVQSFLSDPGDWGDPSVVQIAGSWGIAWKLISSAKMRAYSRSEGWEDGKVSSLGPHTGKHFGFPGSLRSL